MAVAKRVFVFFLVNMAIMVTLSLVLSLLGVGNYYRPGGLDYQTLLIFCSVFGMGGAFVSLLLSKFMAKHMMGVQVLDPRSPGDLGALVQRVHNLARGAGLSKMPEVGIYNSPEPNAFATGPSRNNSLVAVSTGLLDRMKSDEVEGVLAHEVAHIANGDMVTMTLVQGVVNTFVMFLARILAFAASSFLSRGRDDESEAPSHFLQMILVFVFEVALMPLGMIVVGYFSRAREFRADAGSARLAGRDKMIAALRALQKNYQIVNPNEPASLQTLKISGHAKGLARLFSTHPPLEERIRALGA